MSLAQRCPGENRVHLIPLLKEPSLLFFYIANLKLNSDQFNVFWTFTVKHPCAWKEKWNMKHGKNQEMVKKKKTWYIPNAIHTSKSRQRALERQLFWQWLVPHSCQSRRVVFIFMLQQKTGKQGERQLKRPWPEPYAIAVTFIASHIISKLSKKHFSLDTWTNWAGFHLLLCLTTLVGSVQSGFHSPFSVSHIE